MLDFRNFKATPVGTTEYTDSKSNIHTVKHSVIATGEERRSAEEKIAEEVYRIFKAL